MTLERRLHELVEDAGDVAANGQRPSAVEHTRNGVVFVALPEPDVIELKLGPDIAEAAMRTPDTGPSARGKEWVRFAPKTWDKFAVDRLDAWFRVAWRLAAARR